jgi:hypothetical protein
MTVPNSKPKYATKHAQGTEPDKAIATAVQERLENDKLSCQAGMEIADELRVSPSEVGRTADLLEARIHKCLMGFFGYFSPDGKKRKPTMAESVPPKVEEAIRRRLENGSLTCEAAWEVAKETGTSKKKIGSICQALKIKVSPCQLGAF